jgi:hypothetical protein
VHGEKLRRFKQSHFRVALAFLLAAISFSCGLLNTTPALTETSVQETNTPEPTPTPSFLREGKTFVVDDLAITLIEHSLEGCYVSKYNNEICPTAGASFLWLHFKRENRGNSSDLQIYSCFWFHLLYHGEEKDSLWYHSQGDLHPQRESWIGGGCNQLYGGYSDEGWIVFEVPAGIVLSETTLRVESYQGPEFEQIWQLEK